MSAVKISLVLFALLILAHSQPPFPRFPGGNGGPPRPPGQGNNNPPGQDNGIPPTGLILPDNDNGN